MLSLTGPEEILEAILSIADELRPAGTTFCAAMSAGSEDLRATTGSTVESSVLAAEAAASLSRRGIEETDVREDRVSLLTPAHDRLASSLAGVVLATYDAMTDRQRQIISLIKQSETQQQVATHLDVSRQAVNQSLAAAGWPHLKRAEGAVREHLFAKASADSGGGGTPR